MEVAVILPGFHTYTLPPGVPLTESVVLLPLQMVAEGFAVTVAVGTGFTVTITVLVPEHPPFDPLTV